MALFSATASAKQFSWAESFDDDSHFPNGATAPEGWTSTGTQPFTRETGEYFGSNTHSGSYIFATLQTYNYGRDEAFATKMLSLKGGVEYTLSFWYKAPGGIPATVRKSTITVSAATAQDGTGATKLGKIDEAVADWKEYTYKFTPETDGDYCFFLELDANLASSGSVFFDDFSVTGDEPDSPEPPAEDKVVAKLPYSQSFENENGDYDGTSYLPKGWKATPNHDKPEEPSFVTANVEALKAVTGEYYLISPEPSNLRADTVYTSFLDLKKGTTYTISFYLYMPGNASRADFTVSAGKEQEGSALTQLLAIPEAYYTEWTKVETTFTPEEDGLYCFAFGATCKQFFSGEIALEDLTITAPGLTWPPKAAFSFNGLFDINDSNLLAFDNGKVKMSNLSENGEEYLWEVRGAEPEVSTDEDPEFTFPASGEYTIKLTARNSSGENTTEKKVNVTTVGETESLGMAVYNPTDDKILGRGAVPTFDTDANFDFVTGVNHYYSYFAERFDIPAEQKTQLSSVTFYLTNYSLSGRNYLKEIEKPMRVVVYGEKDGRPDLDNVFGKYESKLGESVFGTTGVSTGEMRAVEFPAPVATTGPFYIAFEFDGLTIDEPDQNLQRTLLGMSAVEHMSGVSTLYVMPTAVPEGATHTPDGQYCVIDDVDSSKKGLGLSLTAWVSTKNTTDDIAITSDGKTAFAVRSLGGKLTVSGTHAGERITVANLAGQTLVNTIANDNSTTISADNLPAGIYIVTTPAGSKKVVKY